MRIYNCKIEYEATGVAPNSDGSAWLRDREIWVRAKSVKEALRKASTYREKGEVRKTTEVLSVELAGEINID